MKGKKGAVLILLSYAACLASGESEKSSSTCGGLDFGEGICATGKRQSPIALDTRFANNVRNCDTLRFFRYRELRLNWTLTSSTIKLNPVPYARRSGISGGGLSTTYVLDSIHFHWFSEHIINGARYDLESHFVHYKKTYGNLTEALKHSDGVAVVGVLYEISRPDPIIKELQYLISNNISEAIRGSRLLPNSSEYFRYKGSLTTPECDESVIWTVFRQVRSISLDQARWFRSVRLANGVSVKENFRLLQDTNGRQIDFCH